MHKNNQRGNHQGQIFHDKFASERKNWKMRAKDNMPAENKRGESPQEMAEEKSMRHQKKLVCEKQNSDERLKNPERDETCA